MAAVQHRRSSSASRRANLSYGRGGAGNYSETNSTAPLDPKSLETPTLKTEVYTTGRGGSGNMTRMTDPADARRAQDVEAPVRRTSNASAHVGRGGAANVFHPSTLQGVLNSDNEVAVEDDGSNTSQTANKGFAEKGREWLMGGRRRS